MRSMIITLDGPAGSGKSTVARLLAQRLVFQLLDTGAMYRGLTAHCLDQGLSPLQDADLVIKLARQSPVHFDWDADPPRLHVADRDVTDRLRDMDVTDHVSDLSSLQEVREMMVCQQRLIVQKYPRIVTEGRDQGSVAFPKADVKFYLDANPRVRARRRAAQLRGLGKPADENQILERITQRDQKDTQRRDGPLICPDDAIRIDTSALTLEQVVNLLEDLVQQHVSRDLVSIKSDISADGHGQQHED